MTGHVARHMDKYLGHCHGLLQEKRVPAVDAHSPSVAKQARHLVPDGVILLIGTARDDDHAHLQLTQPLPQRFLSTLPEYSKLMCQSPDAVGASSCDHLAGIGLERREQRAAQPEPDERLHPDGRRPTGQLVVERRARGARRGIGDPRRSAHEDEPAYEVGKVERDPKAKAPTHRVPAVDARTAGLCDGTGGRREVQAVGHVGCDGLQRLGTHADGEMPPDPLPRGRRLAEAVYEDQAHAPMIP